MIQSTTPLGGSATYLSDSQACDVYRFIVGSVYSDQDGTFTVLFAMDGVNFDASESFAYIANSKSGFRYPTHGIRYKLKFVNGATPQTVFRITAKTEEFRLD